MILAGCTVLHREMSQMIRKELEYLAVIARHTGVC
jgi:hypothetical protein